MADFIDSATSLKSLSITRQISQRKVKVELTHPVEADPNDTSIVPTDGSIKIIDREKNVHGERTTKRTDLKEVSIRVHWANKF